ncbi:unnamed protein product, partial [Rotaria sp. Silwood2]
NVAITLDQFKKIMPRSNHSDYLPYLNNALDEGEISTCRRKSAFLAQLAHESQELKYMEEIASGQAYEGRKDLGNIKPGDGKRYKGRGPIQLTGRINYRKAGQALGLDLEAHSEQVSTPKVGFRTSVWFWTSHDLNGLADDGTLASFKEITYKINGGYNGEADREQYWNRAKKVLNCK